MMQLPGKLHEEFVDALVSAFPEQSSLVQMVRHKLEISLSAIIKMDSVKNMAFDLVVWAEANGQRDNLLKGAREANPRNLALIEFERNYKKNFLSSIDSRTANSLEVLLSTNHIQSISLISDFDNSFYSLDYDYEFYYDLYGTKILLSVKTIEANGNEYNHLEIFFPVSDFDAKYAPEREEIFIDGIISFIINHAKIIRCSIENFRNIPSSIKNLNDLKELLIVDCIAIVSIPPFIEALKQLNKLVVNNTSIQDLPITLFNISSLNCLDLSRNKLNSLPAEICNLTNLIELNLSNNKLTYLPSEIGRLIHLSKLDLSGNKLSSLPVKMSQLKKLMSLYVHGNLLGIPTDVRDPQLILSYFSIAISPNNLKEENLNYKKTKLLPGESPLKRLFISIFVVAPGVLGRFVFDFFSPHDPANSSSVILGWGIIVLIVLILLGFVDLDWLVPLIENIRHFFSPVK